jgi:hypothetical protein
MTNEMISDFAITNFRWASQMLYDIFQTDSWSLLAHWRWITPHSWSTNWADGGCDRSIGNAYSS